MGYWEGAGKSDDWWTPKYIFDAMGVEFDLDVAAPAAKGAATYVPCKASICSNSLKANWQGFLWMNSPFEGRNGLTPWLDKFFAHGNGVALTSDRTSAPWWQDAAGKANAVLFIAGKVKFERPDGSVGKSPSNGTTLFASGRRGLEALDNARRAGLGYMATQFTEDLD
jgi:hypothetical protein